MFRTLSPRWLLAAVFAVFGLSACATPAEVTTSPPTTAPMQTTQFDESLDNLNASLMGQEMNNDLARAWADLQSDLRSLVRDLIRRPESVDVEGMSDRLESFWATFGSDPVMSSHREEWESLVAAFEDLTAEISASTGSAVAVTIH